MYLVWRGELEHNPPGRAVLNQLGKKLYEDVLDSVTHAIERVRQDALAQVQRRDEQPGYTLAGALQAESTLAWVQHGRKSQVKLARVGKVGSCRLEGRRCQCLDARRHLSDWLARGLLSSSCHSTVCASF